MCQPGRHSGRRWRRELLKFVTQDCAGLIDNVRDVYRKVTVSVTGVRAIVNEFLYCGIQQQRIAYMSDVAYLLTAGPEPFNLQQ